MKKEKLVLKFSEVDASDLPLVGGKGANLGEMTQARFPVPQGFCVTTKAYELFISQNGIGDEVNDLLKGISTSTLDEIRTVGEKIRQKLTELPMPEKIKNEVKRYWEELGVEKPLAVRSSATAEDLPDASFAGQQESYLNILGFDQLMDAIKKCWISLFTDRAIAYRITNNFDHREVKLSVVVQEMVMAEKSGILFTADPLTGHRLTLTIDASYGLGEALVSGIVEPDTYRIDKRDLKIVDQIIGKKEIAIFPTKEGGTEQKFLDKELSRKPVLNKEEIKELAELGKKVEKHYGTPQDIEWAIMDKKLYLLQTRPITSLYPIEGLQRPDGRFSIFFSMGHQQGMTRPMTPLSISAIRVLAPIGDQQESEYIRVAGSRPYADITLPLKHRLMRRVVMRVVYQFDVLAPEALKQLMKRKEFKKVKGKRVPLRNYRFIFRNIRRVFFALWFRDLTGIVSRTNNLCDHFVQQISDDLNGIPPTKEKIEAITRILPSIPEIFLNWVPEAAAGIAATRLLEKWAKKWLDEEHVEALTLGIPGNVVNEMNMAISDLASIARKNPQLVKAFDRLEDDAISWLNEARKIDGTAEFFEAWDSFIEFYGCRGPSEIDIAQPRWYENPLPVLKVIHEHILREEISQRDRYEEYVRNREEAYRMLMEKARKGIFGRMRTRRFRRMYHVMTEAGGMREHHKFLVIRILRVFKEHFKEVAKELVRQGKLEHEEDIWFLTWPDLQEIWENDATDWKSIVTERKKDFERHQHLKPPLIITSDGETPVVQFKVKDAPEGAILGNPVSPGIVEGTVHVIRDPHQESLAPGEILVAEFTDPGWTPLFINASGLVLEVGGALTHGAVVAREYGIPAVVGVRNATTLLKTGQKVRIDGNRGIIEIIEHE